MKAIRSTLFAALLLGAAACSDSTGSGKVGPPARVDVVSGDLQQGAVGAELPAPLVVKVTDAKGKPVSGQVVNFRVTAGGGTVFAGAAQTNADGEARERWTLGTVAGDTQRVEARAVDATTGAGVVFGVFRAVGVAGPATRLEVVSGDGQSGTVATALAQPLVVKATDAYGNAKPGATITWAGPGSFAPSPSQTAANGTAQTTWTPGTTAGDQTATATVTSGGSGQAAFIAHVNGGPGTRLVVNPHTLSLVVGGTGFLHANTVDAYGNPSPAGATWTSLDPAVAVVTGFLADARVDATGVGTARIVASAPGAGADTALVTVSAAPAGPRMTSSYYDVWTPAGGEAFLVGDTGVVTRLTGGALVNQPRLTTRRLASVWGSSTSNVFVVGDSGTILRWNGTAWSTMQSGTTQSLFGVWGSGPSNVYAVGRGRTVLRFDGTTWAPVAIPAGPELTAKVWVDPLGTVYTADNNAVWRYQGGGWTSIPQRNFGGGRLWGLSTSQVYFGADSVWRVNANSTTTLPYDNVGMRAALTGTAATGLYTVGGLGCGKNFCSDIKRFNGTAWVLEYSYTGRQLLAMAIGADGVGYAAGAYGVVVTNEGGSWHVLQAPAQ